MCPCIKNILHIACSSWASVIPTACANRIDKYFFSNFIYVHVKFDLHMLYIILIRVCWAAVCLRRQRFVFGFYHRKKFNRIWLQFCISNGITSTGSLKLLQKYFGESSWSRTQGFEWHKACSEGLENIEHFRKNRIYLCKEILLVMRLTDFEKKSL